MTMSMPKVVNFSCNQGLICDFSVKSLLFNLNLIEFSGCLMVAEAVASVVEFRSDAKLLDEYLSSLSFDCSVVVVSGLFTHLGVNDLCILVMSLMGQ